MIRKIKHTYFFTLGYWLWSLVFWVVCMIKLQNLFSSEPGWGLVQRGFWWPSFFKREWQVCRMLVCWTLMNRWKSIACFFTTECLDKHKLELSVEVVLVVVLTPNCPDFLQESHHSRDGYRITRKKLRTVSAILILIRHHASYALNKYLVKKLV